MLKKTGYSHLVIILVAIFVWGVNNNLGSWKDPKRVITSDGLYYYAYLPAFFVHHDLELNYLEGGHYKGRLIVWPKTADNGAKVIPVSMGLAMVLSPFFLTAHLTAGITGYEQDGYSLPYRFMMLVSASIFFILGLVFIRKLLRKDFSDGVIAWVLLAIALSTNLLWYTIKEPVFSHVYSFGLIAAFVCLTRSWYTKPSLSKAIGTGLLAGLITLIRPTNALVLLLFVFWDIASSKDFASRLKLFIKNRKLLLIMAAMAMLVWLPQLSYWHMLSGHWFYFSYPDDQGFFFGNPQILNNLFSWRKGWLLYTPVMVFALLGIIVLYTRHRRYFFPVLLYSAAMIYVTSSWWDWWYGGGLGIRPYIDMYAVMALPMAASLSWIFRQKKYLKLTLFILFFLSGFRGGVHHLQYHYNSIHWDSMTREAYLDSFWRITPSGRFRGLLKAPDYELARKGIYQYKDADKSPEETPTN